MKLSDIKVDEEFIFPDSENDIYIKSKLSRIVETSLNGIQTAITIVNKSNYRVSEHWDYCQVEKIRKPVRADSLQPGEKFSLVKNSREWVVLNHANENLVYCFDPLSMDLSSFKKSEIVISTGKI